ncbi:hypothetical protein [Streptomyces sp. NBC_00932]|uniref:hypothetical protein n=1 Tax=Streptomyces sp. NBC_00932 TaxID=2903690 RepID=UPI00386FB995|nr:hypothetical protein OG221_17365 [Streptomyces sp. NBC_00932]
MNRRLVLPAALLVAAAVGVSTGLRLAAYSVPLPTAVTCAFSAFSVVAASVLHLAGAALTTTHRCRVAGCDFRVQLRNVDAVENRRWQEIAAHHPHRI